MKRKDIVFSTNFSKKRIFLWDAKREKGLLGVPGLYRKRNWDSVVPMPKNTPRRSQGRDSSLPKTCTAAFTSPGPRPLM